VRIILDVRIRHELDLIEWKIAHLAGEPAVMLATVSRLQSGSLRGSDLPVVTQHLGMLLQEYCEPF
jgi:hypothetical protein